MKLLLSLLLLACPLRAGDRPKPDPRLASVTSIFVSGNNEAALHARALLSKNKCLTLAVKAEEADATLEVAAVRPPPDRSILGPGSVVEVSSTLTLKSGELLWSNVERESQTVFSNGAKEGAAITIHKLAFRCGCSSRETKR